MAQVCDKMPTPAPAPTPTLGGEQNLNQFIEITKASVLNAESDASLAGVVNGSGFIQSDADEQLLMYFPFREVVKLKSLRLVANEGKEEMSGPKTIKIWVDKPNMDFTDTDSDEVQTIEFSAEDVAKGVEKEVKFVKFQNVHSLTVFIEGNHDEEEVTFFNSLTFIGTPRAGTNMSELKKVG